MPDRADPATPPVCVVLPCRDEAAALPALLGAFPDGFLPLVVDNGSTDGSAEVARRAGARVVSESAPGYGAAVHAGLLAADTDVVAVMDADGSLDPAELPRLVTAVRDHGADLAMGRRVPVGRGAWPWHARWGTAVIAMMLRRRGAQVRDIGPMRVARRQSLLDLQVVDRRFGYPFELMLRAAAAGWTIVEHDVGYRPRAAGTRSKVSGSVRGTLRVARDVARVMR